MNTVLASVVLELATHCALTSATNCNHMLSVGVATSLCSLLSLPDTRVLFLGVELVWNLLEHGSQLQVTLYSA